MHHSVVEMAPQDWPGVCLWAGVDQYLQLGLRFILRHMGMQFTRYQQYIWEKEQVLDRVLQPHYNVVEVGSFRGESLLQIQQKSAGGLHYIFEPLPSYHRKLVRTFGHHRCPIMRIALSNYDGVALFNFVETNPQFSGLKFWRYGKYESAEKYFIRVRMLDTLLPAHHPVHLIKIEAEGGELSILQGAVETLQRYKPIVLFEYRRPPARFYHQHSTMLYELLTTCGLEINTMSRWRRGKAGLTRLNFLKQRRWRWNCYFVAYPPHLRQIP